MLRTLMAAALALVATSAAAPAQQNAGQPAELYDSAGGPNAERKLAKAAKIFELSLPRRRFAEIMTRLRPMLERTIRAESERAGKKPPESASRRMGEIMTEELNALMSALQPKIIPIYAGAFTEPELDALLTLYSSPEGRSVMQKLPSISGRVAEAMQGDLIVFQNRISKRVAEEIVGATE